MCQELLCVTGHQGCQDVNNRVPAPRKMTFSLPKVDSV